MQKWILSSIVALIAAYLLLTVNGNAKDLRMEREAVEQVQSAVARAYSDAPEDVRAVALTIRLGEVPDAALLGRLGPEALSARYLGEPNENNVIMPSYLLHDTMLQDPPNFPAAQALVAAGADVNYSNNTMVFSALKMSQGPTVIPFPDYSPGIPFLRLYLDNGGDPNAQETRGNWGFVPLRRGHNNLEGTLVLLEYGADPWFQAPSLNTGRPMRSFFDSLAGATGNGISAEILFRIVHAGYFQGATAQQLSVVFDRYVKWLGEDQGSKNPRDLRQGWHFQTILDALTATTGVPLPPELARLTEDRVPDQYGGWWMRPDQIRSGDEFVGPTITDGTLIWTHADPNPRQRPVE